VDLYLIHWPQDRLRQETWRAMEDALEQGKARAVGVSNYGVREMEEVLAHGRIVPAVNQIELTPYSYARQRKVIELCRTQDILLQSYSPLTKGRRLDDLRLRRIADKYGKTPAQILLRWNLEHGFVPLPKSSNPDHQRANVGIFDFSLVEEDVAVLDRLG
jgi:diketogulonate reductase-like aldo/keto reductase